MPDLLAAHEAVFIWFGGRCEQLLYDRMHTVVLGIIADRKFDCAPVGIRCAASTAKLAMGNS